MELKILLSALSAVYLLYLVYRWLRSRLPVEGNETVLVFAMYPVLMLLPCKMEIAAMAVGAQTTFFGVYILWSRLLAKGRGSDMKRFGSFCSLFVAVVAVISICGCSNGLSKMGILLFEVLCLLFFYLQLLLGRGNIRALRIAFSANQVWEYLLLTLPFIVLSGVSVLYICYRQADSVWCNVIASLMLAMQLAYMQYERPSCAVSGVWRSGRGWRRRVYSGGSCNGDGYLLEDDRMFVTESVVEDSKLIYALMTLFENERLYMNVNVKINEVARMIGTNKTYLSRALNARLGRNFCQFVNYYRVREACRIYLDNPGIEMRDLGEMCGFSSSSNFSIVFKYNTGFTPGDWCRMVKVKLENNETVRIDDYLL